ncbi:MAG: GNAT family N-acetyltransferase [Clostridia bacterium]|nr:GNAT family N-acetyltransferase [Clostridia bacterium]
MIIQTERLTIRPIVEGDWERLLEIIRDFAVSPYARYDQPLPQEPDRVRDMAKRWEKATREETCFFFAVILDGDMIGYIVFHPTDDAYDCGYCFHSAAQGKGYALESLSALIHAFLKRGVRCFTAGTAIANTPSVRLLTRLGFQKMGEEKVSFYQDDSGSPIYFAGGLYQKEWKEIDETA